MFILAASGFFSISVAGGTDWIDFINYDGGRGGAPSLDIQTAQQHNMAEIPAVITIWKKWVTNVITWLCSDVTNIS